MTGFARSEGALGELTCSVQARSVIGPSLDPRFCVPASHDLKATIDRFRARVQNVE